MIPTNSNPHLAPALAARAGATAPRRTTHAARPARWLAIAVLGAGVVACGNGEPTGNGTGSGNGSGGSGAVSAGGGGGASNAAGAGHAGTGVSAGAGNVGGSGGVLGSGGTGGARGGTGPGGAGTNASGATGGVAIGGGGAGGTSGAMSGGNTGGDGAGRGSMGGRRGSGGASGGSTSGGSTNGGAGGAMPSAGGAGTAGSAGAVTCPSTVLKSGDSNETVQVGTTNRTYILHVPSAYKGTSAVPLVVDFHPLGGTGSQEESSSPYKAQTDPEGVISAYPNGENGPSGGAWNVGPCCVANVDDVAFARALVAQVETKACIDLKRVYAVGFSMGGGMSHYLACQAADLFAAVAPASFDLLKENEDDCKPPRPIAEISFRSSNDPIVPYEGGYSSVVQGMPVTFLGAVGTFQKWAEIDGCTGSPTATDSNDCQYYTSCSGGVQIGLCTMNAGHAPGNATIGWPFIKQYTLP